MCRQAADRTAECFANSEPAPDDPEGRREPDAGSCLSGRREPDAGSCLSVFIFDWDDTLFPTTALIASGPEELREALKRADEVAAQLLSAAVRRPRSRVMLLTSANITWVRQSSRDFLPQVARILDTPGLVRLVSAHLPREQGSADPQAHAMEVARRKLDVVRSAAPSLQETIAQMRTDTVQVLSIGDNPFDLQAAHVLSSALHAEKIFTKTVAFKPRPTAPELIGELRCVYTMMPALLGMPRSFHQSLHPPVHPQHQALQQQKQQQRQQHEQRPHPQEQSLQIRSQPEKQCAEDDPWRGNEAAAVGAGELTQPAHAAAPKAAASKVAAAGG